MESRGKSPNSGDFMSTKTDDSSSAIERKLQMKAAASSSLLDLKRHCPLYRDQIPLIKAASSSDASALSVKHHGKAVASDKNNPDVVLFDDLSQGPHETELRFRLIHFWEARNPHTKTMIGVEMLLIDEQGTAIQGFIPVGRVQTYVPRMKAGCLYRLHNFFRSKSKEVFRVADHSVTVMFSWNSVLSLLENTFVPFPEDRFQFYSHDEFNSNCDLRGDLHGHIKLVNGLPINDSPLLDEKDIANKRHVLVHVQTRDDPVMKLYLWDKAATDFCVKFRSYGSTPNVLLVTTVNPKRLGGTLALTSMASSRVFMQDDVPPTMDYLSWFSSNPDIANKVNAEVVTKPECVTIGELLTYMKQDTSKVAWFECIATIDDVLQDSAWYYIACDGCNSKATKGPNSLICSNKKCKKSQVEGVAQYLTKMSVYDNSEQAVFVLLGDAGHELTGKHASELVAKYFEANESVGDNAVVPVPQALMETIGQKRKFVVKVSDHNLSGKSQSLTVTKVLPAQALQNDVEDGVDEKIATAEESHSRNEARLG